jgi:hypothetical protein
MLMRYLQRGKTSRDKRMQHKNSERTRKFCRKG